MSRASERQRKAAHHSAVAALHSADLGQRRQRQPAAEDGIERRDAEREPPAGFSSHAFHLQRHLRERSRQSAASASRSSSASRPSIRAISRRRRQSSACAAAKVAMASLKSLMFYFCSITQPKANGVKIGFACLK